MDQEQVLLTCSGIADRQCWGQEGIFPPGRLAPVPGVFCLPLSMEQDHLLGLLWSILAAHAPRRWPLASCSWGGKAFFPPWRPVSARGGFLPSSAAVSQPLDRAPLGYCGPKAAAPAPRGWHLVPHIWGEEAFATPRVVPGGCCLSSVALSTAPCQGPLGSVLARCSHPSRAQVVPWVSLSPLPSASSEQKQAQLFPWLYSPGVLACAQQPVLGRAPALLPISSCQFPAFVAGRHESTFHASLARKHNSWAALEVRGVLVIDRCHALRNTPWSTSLLLSS